MADLLPFENGTYRTPEGRAGGLARHFPSWFFHPRFVSIVLRAGAKAWRSKYDDLQWSLSSLEIIRALEWVGVRFEITGIDNLRKPETPCLIVGNHMSTLETAVLPSLIQPIRKCTFVVKESLLEYPVFKHVMRSRDPIAVTQTNPRLDLKRVLEEGADRLRRGFSVVVFPQGARRPVFDPDQFNSIAVKLAQRAGVPIVPVALETGAWGLGRRFSDFGRINPSKRVRFEFGEPLTVEGRGAAEHRAIVDFIESRLRRWAAEDGSHATLPHSRGAELPARHCPES